MLNKEELRDGPFTIATVSKEKIKTNVMSPLEYVSLSGLSNSDNIIVERLERHAKIIKDSFFAKENEIYEAVDLADIDKTIGEISNIKIVNGGEISNLKSRFFPGDIIFGKIRPYLNNVAIVNRKPIKKSFFIGSSEWIRIKPNSHPYYFSLALRAKFTLFQTSASKGSVRPRFNPDKLPRIEIPIIKTHNLLSFIDSIVKRVFEIRTFCSNQIKILLEQYDTLAKVKTKKESIMTKVTPDERSKRRIDANYYILNEIKKEIKKQRYDTLENLVNFSYKKVYKRYRSGDTFEYITTSDVDPNQGEIVFWEEKIYKPKSYVSNKAPGRAQMLLKENQILIPYLKLSVESIAWVPKDLENYIGSNGFAVLEAKNEDYGFLYLFLRSRIIKDQLKLIAAGTIMEDIGKDDLNEIVIFMPDEKTKKYLSDRMKELLKIRWQARKAYIQIMSLFENFCSHFLDIEGFYESLKDLSQELNDLNNRISKI